MSVLCIYLEEKLDIKLTSFLSKGILINKERGLNNEKKVQNEFN